MASALTPVVVSPLEIERFQAVLEREQWEALQATQLLAREVLEGRVIWCVNSTARGGGVAEMLWSLLGYARGAGIDARWLVIGGDSDFFQVTKRLHNHLHGHRGDGGGLGRAEQAVYERTLEGAAAELHALARPGDIVFLHDPQTAGLIPGLQDGVQVVWRSHIGRDAPNEIADAAWRFLIDYVRPAAGWIFSRREYVPPGLDPDRVTLIAPSIDVFAPKNQDLPAETVDAIMAAAGMVDGPVSAAPAFTRQDGTPGRVDRQVDLGGAPPPPAGTRLVTQVSRWDRLKDPVGIVEGFAAHLAQTDAHLMLAGPAVAAVSDDPEGLEVLGEVRAARERLDPALAARVHLACLPMDDAEENAAMVNALQRGSAIVVQKSLAEGFGLTVAEAMWKARPVVASAVGGIQDQIEDGVSGVLLRDPEDLAEFGAAVRGLLEDPARAEALGAAARTRIRDHFINARHLIQYAELCGRLVGGR